MPLLNISSMLFNHYSNFIRQIFLSLTYVGELRDIKNLPKFTWAGNVEVGLAAQHLLLNSGLHQIPESLGSQ